MSLPDANDHLRRLRSSTPCPVFDVGIEGLFAPCIRPSRIDVDRQSAAVMVEHDDHFATCGIPMLACRRPRQVSAVEIATFRRAFGVDSAAGTDFAMATPLAARARDLFNLEQLTAKRAVVAATAAHNVIVVLVSAAHGLATDIRRTCLVVPRHSVGYSKTISMSNVHLRYGAQQEDGARIMKRWRTIPLKSPLNQPYAMDRVDRA